MTSHLPGDYVVQTFNWTSMSVNTGVFQPTRARIQIQDLLTQTLRDLHIVRVGQDRKHQEENRNPIGYTEGESAPRLSTRNNSPVVLVRRIDHAQPVGRRPVS